MCCFFSAWTSCLQSFDHLIFSLKFTKMFIFRLSVSNDLQYDAVRWELYTRNLKINLAALRPCHTRPFSLQLNGVALQVSRKTSSCDIPCLQLVSQWKIALQVAEKIEAASTFRQCYATSCSVWHLHCNLSRNFLRRNRSLYNIIRMPLTYLNTRQGLKYNLIAGRKQAAYVWHANCNLQYFFLANIASCKPRTNCLVWHGL